MKLGIVAGKNTDILVKNIGATGIMLPAGQLANQGVDAAMAPLREAGLEVCQIGAFGFNPLSLDKDKQEIQKQLLEKVIPMVPQTGCRIIIVNGGNYDPSGFFRGHTDNFTDKALDEAARGLAPLLELAESYEVKLAIEPFIQAAINTPDRYLALKKRVRSSALTLSLDISNFFTFEDMWHSADTVKRICDTLAGEYALIHCKDLQVSSGVHIHIDETPLGTGVIDWKTALPYLAPTLEKGVYFIYEHIKEEQHAYDGMAYLRRISTELNLPLFSEFPENKIVGLIG